MRTLLCIFFLTFCLLAVQGKEKEDDAKADDAVADDVKEEAEEKEEEASDKKDTDAGKKEEEKEEAEDEAEDDEDDNEDKDDKEETEEEAKEEAKEDAVEKAEEAKEFACNLKYKKIGCYADKGLKVKPLQTFLMSDSDMGTISKKGKLPKADAFNNELPKFTCKCANEALTAGNAIFGVQNIAECWSGPDDSKYDRDGPSEECVTFDFANCGTDSEVCVGKKHSNFMYFIDAPEHTKTQEEINKELAEDKKKAAAEKAAAEEKKKKKTASKKKGKKSKKAKKST